MIESIIPAMNAAAVFLAAYACGVLAAQGRTRPSIVMGALAVLNILFVLAQVKP